MSERAAISLQKPDWRHSPVVGLLLLAAYIILAGIPMVFAYVFGSADDPPEVMFGMDLPLMGFTLLNLQFLLSGRFKFVDRPFGIDNVMVFHKIMAVFTLYVLIAHPILLILGKNTLNVLWFGRKWEIPFGEAALLLLMVVVFLSTVVKPLKIDYQRWRLIHRAVLIVVALAAIHSMYIGDDLEYPAMWIYWIFLMAISGGTFIYRNLIVARWRQRHCRVSEVKAVAPGVWNITYTIEDGKPFRYQPGQFMFVKFLRNGKPDEQHHYTISSSPTRTDALTQTIKESGDYTRTIGQIKPGDRAQIEGPYGRFSLVYHNASKFIFIAGGIGITPIMSMLRYLRDTNDTRPRILFYASRTAADIVFREELEAMPHLQVVHVLSRPIDSWKGPHGHITKEIVRGHSGDMLHEADIYMSGPAPMMESIYDSLVDLGVSRRKIHFEKFTS